MEKHETDWQRKSRQRSEVKKYGITGSTPNDAKKRIKEHIKGSSVKKALDKFVGKSEGIDVRDTANKDLEDKAQKLGYYPYGHKNYGDVYEK